MMQHAIRRGARAAATAALISVVGVACSGDNPQIGRPDTTVLVETTAITQPPSMDVRDGEPMPAERCAANQAAGTVVYLSGNGFAASASIIDVLMAAHRGYYDDLCLDVEIRPSYPTDNYTRVVANDAQFASGGSFSELIDFAAENLPDFVVLAVEGRTGIDSLITKPGAVDDLGSMRGATIGVEGALTPSVRAMLGEAGLLEGDGYELLELEGHDPVAHMANPDVVGFAGYQNDEPFRLDEAGVGYDVFDPSQYDIPGSFGVLYSNRQFVAEHPTAAQDFLRATMRGLADALDEPRAAVRVALEFAEGDEESEQVLTLEGERYRWSVEAELVQSLAGRSLPFGVPDRDRLHREVEVYTAVGLFDGVEPVIDTLIESDVLAECYAASGRIIWPAT